ncbi:hypothetical protein HAX54_025225, partial [Datura stramonium]|nr:hypothetical protein [Datura stramonium]
CHARQAAALGVVPRRACAARTCKGREAYPFGRANAFNQQGLKRASTLGDVAPACGETCRE